jgi:Ca2+-binding EF-hand superfamily protein
MLRAVALALVFPTLAVAQTMPATHAFSGLDATSARARLERDGRRPYGPRFEAAAMPAAQALDFLPGQKDPKPQPVPPIRVVKPSFRLPEQDLGLADVQDILFFAEARLVRMRIHLKASGEPLSKRWTDQLRKYFDFLDRDGDGVLNRLEAEFALSNAGVVQMFHTGYAYQRADDVARTFADIDRDSDGSISFDEFAHYYGPSAGRVVSTLPNPNRDVYADTLTDELFKLFDTDKDGRLSRAELNAVEKLLATLDADEDECLAATEIAPHVFTGGGAVRPVPFQNSPPGETPMLAYRPGSIPDSILETILARYDKDKNLRFSKAENPFGDELFQALDKNGNGELSVTELLAWKDAAPDLEVEMVFGSKAGESAVRLLPRADGKPTPLATAFRPAGDGAAVLMVGTQSVQLSCYTPRGVYAQVDRPSFLAFPDNGKGFVTEKDIGGPQFQAFRVLFDMIDRDGDGKLSRAEYDAFFSLQQSFTALPLSLVYQAQTPSLFQFLDANGDGRLSVREVRDAWSRLIALEPNGKEFVTKGALRPQGALRFGRSAETVMANPSLMYTQQSVRQATRGPLWFRKFDRNADGELSRSEFPGPAEEFDRLDANHDGYISLEEAEAADKTLRARK